MQNKKIQLPADVAWILQTLNAGGHEAYIVGGCVRDSILGRIPQDWDITTSATPQEAKTFFSHTFDTGIRHGTITVVLHKQNYEVTTYRIDGEYADCRHPNTVSFTQNLTDDLLRRDFTMNAIAYHPNEGFRDPFCGQADITAGIIRGVGEPEKRFQEDALRMLRCVRFSAQLGFSIEPKTWDALCKNAKRIEKISVERIKEELEKLWLAPYKKQIPLLWESGLLLHIDPSLSDRISQKGSQIVDALSACGQDALLCWCVILQDCTPLEAVDFLKRMKCDNHTIKRVSLLLEHINADLPLSPYPVRKLVGRIGVEAMEQLLHLHAILHPHSKHEACRSLLARILEENDCLTLKSLKLSGKDLMQMGIPHGKTLGWILDELLDLVLRFPEKNDPAILIKAAQELLQTIKKES